MANDIEEKIIGLVVDAQDDLLDAGYVAARFAVSAVSGFTPQERKDLARAGYVFPDEYFDPDRQHEICMRMVQAQSGAAISLAEFFASLCEKDTQAWQATRSHAADISAQLTTAQRAGCVRVYEELNAPVMAKLFTP